MKRAKPTTAKQSPREAKGHKPEPASPKMLNTKSPAQSQNQSGFSKWAKHNGMV